jgi:hypothetical protein
MEQWEIVRLRCERDREPIKRVARDLGLSPNTVRKYLRVTNAPTPPRYLRSSRHNPLPRHWPHGVRSACTLEPKQCCRSTRLPRNMTIGKADRLRGLRGSQRHLAGIAHLGSRRWAMGTSSMMTTRSSRCPVSRSSKHVCAFVFYRARALAASAASAARRPRAVACSSLTTCGRVRIRIAK